MSVLPVAGSKFPAVCLGKVALDVIGLGVGPPCLRLDSEETEMNCTVPGITPDDGPLEGMPVLEPLEHSVPEKSSHDKPMEEAPALEPLEHSVLGKPLDGGSLEGRSVVDWLVRLIMEPLENSVLVTAVVWEPLEHSDCVATDHVDIDSFWMAPWDAGGTFGDCCRLYVASWRTVFRSVVRLSCRPAFVDKDCSLLFRSLGWICVLDVHVGRTDVPTGSPGDDPRKNLPPCRCRRVTGECLMGKSSRRSGITGVEQSPAMCFPRTEANPGEVGTVELGYRTVVGISQIYSALSECGAVELGFSRASCPPGESGPEECDYIRPAPLTE